MGRDTEIYMLNRALASTNLYKDLKDKRLYKKTFKEFWNERNSDETFANILATVEENINEINPDDLFEIIDYLEEELRYGKYDTHGLHWQNDKELRLKNERIVEEIFDNYGISLLYDIHTSTACYSYMFQFGNYTDFFPIEGNYGDGYSIRSEDFLMFNDYMILIMYKILKSELKGSTINDLDLSKNEIDQIIQKYETNQVMNHCIEKEFNWLKSCMSGDDKTYKAEKNTVYSAELFLNQSLEMKRRIDPAINHRIVILDSI